jgi:Bacterial Ig domain/FG-GAP repeat
MFHRALPISLAGLLLAVTTLAQTPPTTVTFSSQIYNTGPAPTAVVSGDFNQDGKPDLAVIDEQSSSVQILLGVGAGKFSLGSQTNTGTSPAQIVAGTFNLSGHQDLAVANGDKTMTILLGKGDGTFTTESFPLGGVPLALIGADFLNNGLTQLATVECASQRQGPCSLNIHQGDTNAKFHRSQKIALPSAPAPGLIASDDFNHDGKPDLAVAVLNQVLVFVDTSSFNGKGSATVALHTTITPPKSSGICGLAAGHFVKNNPTPDLSVEVFDNVDDTSFPNSNYIFLNNGFGFFFLKSKVPASGGFGHIVAVADINGDGIQDLIAAGTSFHNGDLTYALGRGDGTFSAFKEEGGFGPNSAIITRDLSLDSRQSVVLAVGDEFGTGGTAVLLNQNALTNCPPPGSATLAVKICSASTATNKISVRASGNSPNGVKRVELWVDGTKRTQAFSDQLHASVSVSPGNHQVTIVGVDLYDTLVKQTLTVNVP